MAAGLPILRLPATRAFGWIAAGLSSAALLSGAAAMTLAAQRPTDAIVMPLDLTQMAAAPVVAAISDPSPQVVDEAPVLPDADPAPEVTAPVPEPETAPEPMRQAMALQPDVPDAVAKASAKPAPKPVKKPKTPKADPPKKAPRPAEIAAPPKDAPEAKPAASAATAPKPEAKVRVGGGVSPKAYAKAVMKKVRATRKQKGAGKGVVVVGFSIAPDGGLASVVVVQGSGNSTLDQIAIDHVRRSAPFAPPPERAGRDYSFEFVGK